MYRWRWRTCSASRRNVSAPSPATISAPTSSCASCCRVLISTSDARLGSRGDMSQKDKDILSGLDDLDWDSALDEWEQKSFEPAVARDADTNQVAERVGADPLDAPQEGPQT